MKTKFLLTALLMLFFLNTVNAQSHKVGQANYNCKLNKKGWFFNSEKLSCPACEATENKEKAAKAAEDKRRNDVAVAKAKADKIASDLANKKKQQEIAEKNKVTEVAVTMPKNTVSKNTPSNKKTEEKTTKSSRFMSGNFTFYNDNGEIKPGPNSPKLNIRRYIGTFKLDDKPIARYLHPAEIGVIEYGSGNVYCNGWEPQYFDIVDYEIKPFFSDKSMHHIEHFYANWFVIGYYPCESYNESSRHNFDKFTSLKLYNVVTKKFKNIEINESFSYLNLISTQYSSYHHGIGHLVFHNRFYESGEYNTQSKNISKMEHGSYELLIDKLAGGNNMWKAAICVRVRKSVDNYNYTIYLMSKNNEFTSFTVDATEFNKYYK